jgi:hypothetical protein
MSGNKKGASFPETPAIVELNTFRVERGGAQTIQPLSSY